MTVGQMVSPFVGMLRTFLRGVWLTWMHSYDSTDRTHESNGSIQLLMKRRRFVSELLPKIDVHAVQDFALRAYATYCKGLGRLRFCLVPIDCCRIFRFNCLESFNGEDSDEG
jgi:hypothetical protein